MKRLLRRFGLRVAPAMVLLGSLFGPDPVRAVAQESSGPDFLREIRPILAERCFACHGPDEGSREGSLRLDRREDALQSGDSGVAAIVPGDADASELVRRILSDDSGERMPPDEVKKPLTDRQRELLIAWVESGAEYATHWAYEPLDRPKVPFEPSLEPPATADAESVSPAGPIDAWLRAGWPAGTIVPSAADRYRLARRAALDLTGLPPDLDEVEAFVTDDRPDAWMRYVDRQLASPRFGERWAWPWLDAARYADSNGYQGDSDRTMWPWRDWVVDSLNRDLPFDVRTEWQLAGDLIPGASDEQRLATGFLRNHMINGEGGRIPEENRVDYVMDMTETTGTVWLAATLNCCRCHDHKFDPISRRDYYRWFAFFDRTPVDGSGGNPRTPPVLSVPSDEQRRDLERLERELADEVAALEAFEPAETPQEEGAAPIVPVAARNQDQWRALLDDPSTTEEQAALIRQRIARLDARQALRDAVPVVMVMEDVAQPRTTYMLDKGLYTARDEAVEAGVPETFGPWNETLSPDRRGLAHWLLDNARPVTARVAANRIWQELFGIGLVKTSEDFGSQGEPPVNAALLTGLAEEFVASDWSAKGLIRKVVLSSGYRASSIRSDSAADMDPANRLLTRGARYRLASWMIRDQALAVSGLLVDRIGGAPVHPYQPDGVWQEATFGARGYPQSHGADLHRRSLYTFWRRIVAPTMFFDTSSRQTCSVATARTNTPLHALATLNDVTYIEAARVLADEELLIAVESDREDARLLEAIFRRVLRRPPTADETAVLIEAFRRHRGRFETARDEAQGLVTYGETASPPLAAELPVERRAAAALVALTLLNLDETISKE